MGWIWWVGLALALGVIEMLTVDLTFLMLGGGALAGGIAGALGAPLVVQVLIAVVVAGLLLFIVRPLAKRRMESATPDTFTGVAALVGKTATVVADVTDRTGRIKIHGDVWTARTHEPGIVLHTGTTVQVVRIDGATAVIAPVTPIRSSDPYGPL